MSLWLVRAGKFGEFEQKFFSDARIYLTWEGLEDRNLSQFKDYAGLKKLLADVYPSEREKTRINWASQIAPFVFSMHSRDWVVLPQKHKAAIAFAEILSDYEYDPKAAPLFRHSRHVKWLNTDVPRSVFDQDLLYSFGAFMTVCRVTRNSAESRVRAIAAAGWKTTNTREALNDEIQAEQVEAEAPVDIERLARDQITKLVGQKFAGHGMARLVGAILRAQGFQTFVSPEGPDGGIDILAAPGQLGFGEPRICIQVKSSDVPVERSVLDALGGVSKKVGATHGLLVSWGGFRKSIEREEASQYFHVRLWDQDMLVDQLLSSYANLEDDVKAELPLKQFWTVAMPEKE